MNSNLAPSGTFKNEATQTLAAERAAINSEKFSALGLKRSHRELGPFLRRLALYPQRIPEGSYYGMSEIPISYLIDHQRLYLLRGIPYAAIFHPYSHLDSELLRALADWTEKVGLGVLVDACSEYYPGNTLRIILHRAGTKFLAAEW